MAALLRTKNQTKPFPIKPFLVCQSCAMSTNEKICIVKYKKEAFGKINEVDFQVTQHGEFSKIPPSKVNWTTKAKNFLLASIAHFLPRGYPNSVCAEYKTFAQWSILGATVSSAIGVFSTQALLYAVGLGSGSIPLAAGLNWVIKDGLGQLGGVLFASRINERFDADPRRWRFISAAALDIACLIELLTPTVPSLFLPLASIANIGKNISWLSASASRAGIHKTFAQHDNLADITAKTGSQNIAASIAGTTLGIVISTYLHASTDAVTIVPLLGIFFSLSFTHLLCTYQSLKAVTICSLNQQRAEIVINKFVKDEDLLSPIHVKSRDRFLLAPWAKEPSIFTRSELSLGPDPRVMFPSGDAWRELNRIFIGREKYIVNVVSNSRDIKKVCLVLLEGATEKDVIQGYLHATIIRIIIEECLLDTITQYSIEKVKNGWRLQLEQLQRGEKQRDLTRLVELTYDCSKECYKELLPLLESAGWMTQVSHLESQSTRIKIV